MVSHGGLWVNVSFRKLQISLCSNTTVKLSEGLCFTFELLLNLSEPDIKAGLCIGQHRLPNELASTRCSNRKCLTEDIKEKTNHKNGASNITGQSCLVHFSGFTAEMKGVSLL